MLAIMSQANVKGSDHAACMECGTTTTPQWRRGPDGPGTLCNACGV